MKLLILTQALDSTDSVLGFFQGWVRAFADRCQKITVIALRVGNYKVPSNVKVLSLGKEIKRSRIKYLRNFFGYLWRERNDYDIVFVHMNPEYVVIAGWWWHLTGKKIWLWRNHPAGGGLVRIAARLSHRVFCTTPQSFVVRYSKTEIMPIGIDVNYFKPNPTIIRAPGSLLCLGRIAPIKRLELVFQAAAKLKSRKIPFTLRIVGGVASVSGQAYLKQLKKLAHDLEIDSLVVWQPAVSAAEARDEYCRAKILVNTTPSGSFDKTIGEALACGTLVVSSNKALKNLIDNRLLCQEGSDDDLTDRLAVALRLTPAEQARVADEARQAIELYHSLESLTQKLFN